MPGKSKEDPPTTLTKFTTETKLLITDIPVEIRREDVKVTVEFDEDTLLGSQPDACSLSVKGSRVTSATELSGY